MARALQFEARAGTTARIVYSCWGSQVTVTLTRSCWLLSTDKHTTRSRARLPRSSVHPYTCLLVLHRPRALLHKPTTPHGTSAPPSKRGTAPSLFQISSQAHNLNRPYSAIFIHGGKQAARPQVALSLSAQSHIPMYLADKDQQRPLGPNTRRINTKSRKKLVTHSRHLIWKNSGKVATENIPFLASVLHIYLTPTPVVTRFRLVPSLLLLNDKKLGIGAKDGSTRKNRRSLLENVPLLWGFAGDANTPDRRYDTKSLLANGVMDKLWTW